jgi:hypothetical protein
MVNIIHDFTPLLDRGHAAAYRHTVSDLIIIINTTRLNCEA